MKGKSNLLFIIYAGCVALLSYSLVYMLRKPFTAATFEGLEFLGMNYKVATSIIQIAGYMIAKLLGIKYISELKKENRLRFIIGSVLLAETALLAFALLPVPYNIFALFFNGLALGCMWGVIFSFLEGRKISSILASIMGLSIAFSSGVAKSTGLFLLNDLQINPFWMPALIGAVAAPLLIGTGFLLNRLPQPDAEDIACCTERVPMDAKQRRSIFRRFAPLLGMLFIANLCITVMQDIKEDFLVKIVDVTAVPSWTFSMVDGTVTVIILILFCLISLNRNHLNTLYTLLALVALGLGSLVFIAFNYNELALSPVVWVFMQSLGLYIAYLSFQTLFFERFVASFRIKGNVGFFIITIDFMGYLGTVCVLILKEFLAPEIGWLHFYNNMIICMGTVCCLLFVGAAVCLKFYAKPSVSKQTVVSPYAVQ